MSDPPRSDRPPYLSGDIIAQKYRLTRLLGEGGMGAVWLARNIKLDVDVAIKLIRHELATEETSARLLQEARAAARIGHRSIVRIFDFGETELDDPFIVMEVLAGESLREVLERKGRLPATHAVRTILPIASALVEAHASGIVHRDLKPENIVLVPDKSGGLVPKLVDFGIAKLHRGGDDNPDEQGRGMFVVGTPEYMSPEQAGGRDEVDEGADVWALAVILYEAITGRVPFAGPNYAALIFAIMTEEPAPLSERMAGDPALWAILQGALAKMSSGRPTMRAFGASLAGWAIARGIDTDVEGTSLSAHWQSSAAGSPFSAMPPAMDDGHAADLVIPKAPGMPTGARPDGHLATTEAPPAQGTQKGALARGRGGLWLAVGALAAAVLVVAMRGRPAPNTATQTAAAAVAPATPQDMVAIAPADPGSAAPAASSSAPIEATAEPAPTAPPSASATARGKPGPRKPPRRLPIAKQPNF
jgi:serine/threonine-protein kinase